jgi:peptidoglycan hydrolase-like protein with peptidoglycan-binding domain
MANLSSGSRGAEVVAVQRDLNRLGASPRLVEDGDFGPATDRAVRAFQASAGLSVDGIVGPQTAGALAAAIQALNRSTAPSKAAPKSRFGWGSAALAAGLLWGLARRKKKT